MKNVIFHIKYNNFVLFLRNKQIKIFLKAYLPSAFRCDHFTIGKLSWELGLVHAHRSNDVFGTFLYGGKYKISLDYRLKMTKRIV